MQGREPLCPWLHHEDSPGRGGPVRSQRSASPHANGVQRHDDVVERQAKVGGAAPVEVHGELRLGRPVGDVRIAEVGELVLDGAGGEAPAHGVDAAAEIDDLAGASTSCLMRLIRVPETPMPDGRYGSPPPTWVLSRE